MAQEIVKWCDRHFDKDERVIGATRLVSLDSRPVELELCSECWDELASGLATQVAEHGRPVSGEALAQVRQARPNKSGGTRRRVQCPVEGCETRLYRASFRDHLASEHGTTLADMERQLGHTLEGEPINYTCPECGAGFSTPQGLGAHRRATHGVVGKTADQQPELPEPEPEPEPKAPAKRTPAKRTSKSTKAKTSG